MPLSKILFIATLIVVLALECFADSVTNVSAVQRPGTDLVDIRYKLTGSGQYWVGVEISSDSGVSYSVNSTSVSGDVGEGVEPGLGKHIVWDAGADWPGQFSEEMRFRVSAVVLLEDMVLVTGGTLATSNELDGTVVDTFYLGNTEVTWGEWQTVRTWAAANGYDIGSRGEGCVDDHPVRMVNWYDVVKWCNSKSEMEGLTPVYSYNGSIYRSGEPTHTSISQNLSAVGYRLPKEVEWEFAARGGIQTNGYTYSGSNDLDAVGWYVDNSSGAACDIINDRGTWPVGQKEANELGLYDMSGSMREWCWDQNGSGRRLRGGSWRGAYFFCAVSNRYSADPSSRSGINGVGGFRLARSSGN